MKNRAFGNISLALLATIFISLFGGITSDALVRTSRKKYKTVKFISSSDKILTFSGNIDNPELKKSKTEAIIKYEVKKLISVETLSGMIRVRADKKFYDYYSEKWIAAKDLSEDNFLTCWDPESDEFYGIAVLSLTKITLDSPIFLYSFLLKEDHAYFVIDSSGNSILVHNVGGLMAAFFAWAAAGGTSTAVTAGAGPTIISVSTGAAATGAAGTLYTALAPLTIPATIIGGAAYAGYTYGPAAVDGAHWCFSSSFRKKCRNARRAEKARTRAAAEAMRDYSNTYNDWQADQGINNLFRSVPVVPETNPVTDGYQNQEQPEEVPE